MKPVRYNDHIIESKGFKRADNMDGEVAQFDVFISGKWFLFVFAMSGIDVLHFSKIDTKTLEKFAMDEVTNKIDTKLKVSPYFFEFDGKKFCETKNPKWWIGSKQKPMI